MSSLYSYVTRKALIYAIHGLSCAKYRSILCATKCGFVAHSMDYPLGAHVLRKVWIKQTELGFVLF